MKEKQIEKPNKVNRGGIGFVFHQVAFKKLSNMLVLNLFFRTSQDFLPQEKFQKKIEKPF